MVSQAKKPIVILGAGVSGLAAALSLVEAGHKVVLIEKADQVGGAAATIPIPEGRFVPAGYHQIVGSDKPLLEILKKLGLLEKVVWKQTSISTLVKNKKTNLASPWDMIRFDLLPVWSRIRYMFFGVRCLLTHDWSAWRHRSVTELVSSWAGRPVLEQIFKPLIDIKFGFSSDKADAAWLGKRLSHREGAVPFGAIPNQSWTQLLCQELTNRIVAGGGEILLKTAVQKLTINKQGIITAVQTDAGKMIKPAIVLSTLPPPVLVGLLKQAQAPQRWISLLEPIKYISAYSLIAGVNQPPFTDYWTIFLHPRRVFGGCFTLSVLNESLVTKKDQAVINLFTNVPAGEKPWTLDEYVKKCLSDLRQVTGNSRLAFNWVKTTYIPWVSPVFETNYENPKPQLGKNLFLAGIYKTYPKLSSTGEAMADGQAAAELILKKV